MFLKMKENVNFQLKWSMSDVIFYFIAHAPRVSFFNLTRRSELRRRGGLKQRDIDV